MKVVVLSMNGLSKNKIIKYEKLLYMSIAIIIFSIFSCFDIMWIERILMYIIISLLVIIIFLKPNNVDEEDGKVVKNKKRLQLAWALLVISFILALFVEIFRIMTLIFLLYVYYAKYFHLQKGKLKYSLWIVLGICLLEFLSVQGNYQLIPHVLFADGVGIRDNPYIVEKEYAKTLLEEMCLKSECNYVIENEKTVILENDNQKILSYYLNDEEIQRYFNYKNSAKGVIKGIAKDEELFEAFKLINNDLLLSYIQSNKSMKLIVVESNQGVCMKGVIVTSD